MSLAFNFSNMPWEWRQQKPQTLPLVNEWPLVIPDRLP